MEKLKSMSEKELLELMDAVKNQVEERKIQEKLDNRPTLNENPDWSSVTKQAEDIVKSKLHGTYHDDNDDDHYMWEAVMTTLYGSEFWDWFNNN